MGYAYSQHLLEHRFQIANSYVQTVGFVSGAERETQKQCLYSMKILLLKESCYIFYLNKGGPKLIMELQQMEEIFFERKLRIGKAK